MSGVAPPLQSIEESRLQASTRVRWIFPLILIAAAFRLVQLQWLHPLNWDEIEFFAVTRWIGEGRMPFRDFWEHHTPLQWLLFAPFTWLSSSPGVAAVIALRWAQVPLWAATLWVIERLMVTAGLSQFARRASMLLLVASSMFMLPAIEYRVEALGCFLLFAGLLLASQERWMLAGVAFCLAGFANLRLGPVLAVAVVYFLVRERRRAVQLITGGLSTLLVVLGFFAATGSLRALVQQVWVDNLAEKYAEPVVGGFVHRLLVPFGIRVIASDRLFEIAAVDAGGVTLLLLGLAGVVAAFRVRGPFLLFAVLQLANVAFVARMKFIYNYHLVLLALLMVPMVALAIDRMSRRSMIAGLLILAFCVNAFAAIFRGKELDLAYQDLIMREVHERTVPGETVWSGIPWALRREPAYRLWFLPELARILVREGLAEPYRPATPPAALVVDHNALLWIATVQRELARTFIRHYIPVWRELWIPGMNARLAPGRSYRWLVPRDGTYTVHASPALARHSWFSDPLLVASFKREEAVRFQVELTGGGSGRVTLAADGIPLGGESVRLRKGQILTAHSLSDEPIGVVLLSSRDRLLFRQPPPGVTLEGETTRITHVPQFGASIER